MQKTCRVYKHFNRPYEVLWGLSFVKLTLIAISVLSCFWLLFSLRLSPINPLSLVILIPTMLIVVLIIKSDDNYYTNLLSHPFKDHIYLTSDSSKIYPHFKTEFEIKDSIIYFNDRSIAKVIKVKLGKSIHNLNDDEKQDLIETWGHFISQYNQISNFDDYFSKLFNSEELHLHTQISAKGLIPSYYIIVKQEALDEDKGKFAKLLCQVEHKLYKLLGKEAKAYEHKQELELIEEKCKFAQAYMDRLKLESKILDSQEIKALYENQIPIHQNKTLIHDKASYIELKSKQYCKLYSLKTMPDEEELFFWLKALQLKLKSQSFINIKFEYRDARQDQKKAENKANLLSQLKKASRASTQSIITDSTELSKKLLDKPYSYNLSIDFGIISSDLEDLKKLDREVIKPIRNCIWDNNSFNQINSLRANILGASISKNNYRHYSDLDFACACFNFFAANFPKDDKYPIGISLTDNNPINLNEANRDLHQTRSLNFIGDSGSGKSALAKSMLKKRLEETQQDITIIDFSKKGWTEFSKALGGQIIDLNDSSPGLAYFNPLWQAGDIQDLLGFFYAISDMPKLELEDKDFLSRSLKAFFKIHQQARLSDLYLFWSRWEDREISQKWQNTIAPYTHICSGAYAYLLDGTPQSYNSRLKLFQFSAITQDKSFNDVCLYLINKELEKASEAYDKQNTLVLDEAWRLLESPKALEFITYFARAGRAMDCALWTISQKPSDLTSEIYSSASTNISFQLKEKADQVKLKSLAGFAEHELELFKSPLLKKTGNCIIKSTYGTDLVQVVLDKEDEILCSSQKDFQVQREELAYARMA